MRFFLLLLVCSFYFGSAVAQAPADSLRLVQEKDSVKKVQNLKRLRDPKKATLFSAVLPGAGQVYNRKYWKVPILYTGAAVLGYYINFNHQEYVRTRNSYLQVKAGQPDYYNGSYSATQLAQLREFWRRNRDLLIIVAGFTYLLNIADAAVDAHLSGFDVSDDLSLQWQPQYQQWGKQPVVGLQICLNFK
jgi:hypothetical protein